MRNLEKTLKTLSQVKPGSGYSLRSKRLIMSASRKPVTTPAAAGLSLFQVLRGSGVMAASVLALIGGITVARVFVSQQPTLVGSVDVQTLEAEAQAIDSQLGLAQAQHSAVKAAEVKVSNQLGTSIRDASLIAGSEITELAIAAAGADGDASSVDEALLALID